MLFRRLINLLSRCVNHGLGSMAKRLSALSPGFCRTGTGTCPTCKRQVGAPKASENVPIIAQHIFSLALKAERADGYQTTVTGIQGGYR